MSNHHQFYISEAKTLFLMNGGDINSVDSKFFDVVANWLVLRDSKEEKDQAEIELLAQQLNNVSDEVLGYNEGRFEEIMEQILELKKKAQNQEIKSQFSEIVDAVRDLNNLIDDIEHDV